MRKLIENHLIKDSFRSFFAADITSVEEGVAVGGIREVFAPVIIRAIFWALLGIPAIITLDTTNVLLFLTPIAFVSGSAWFILSLSTIKLKFKDFASDITRNIFESFVISLFLMLLMALIALNGSALSLGSFIPGNLENFAKIISAILASIVAIRIVYLIVVGSIQYATNDAMLTGQRELAQEYYRRFQSFTYQVADLIRSEPDIKATNYYISDAFSRIFNIAKGHVIRQARTKNSNKLKAIDQLNDQALEVLSDPEKDQKAIYQIFFKLLSGFKKLLNPANKAARKINYIDIEYECLKKGKDSHRTTALRYATIFALIYEILQDEGEDIFL